MSSLSRKQLEAWLKTIDASGRVLDIGGAQNPIKGRTKSWDVREYVILDLAEPHETKRPPDLIIDLNLPSALCDKKFDMVFCIEVMEYLWNPMQAIRNMSGYLLQGGDLYISTHQLYPTHNPRGLDYLRYTRNGIVRMLNEAGFEIISVTSRELLLITVDHLMRIYKSEGMRWNREDVSEGHLIHAKRKK